MTNLQREKITKVYYNLSELAEVFNVSSMWIGRLCTVFHVPTTARNNRHKRVLVHKDAVWMLMAAIQMGREGYRYDIIRRTLATITDNERDQITAACAALLGEQGTGPGIEIAFHVKMEFRQRAATDKPGQSGDILRIKPSLGSDRGDRAG